MMPRLDAKQPHLHQFCRLMVAIPALVTCLDNTARHFSPGSSKITVVQQSFNAHNLDLRNSLGCVCRRQRASADDMFLGCHCCRYLIISWVHSTAIANIFLSV